jgi:DNA ligase-1
MRLAEVESLGGEGLMLRTPGSKYEWSRSSTLLKVKTFHDEEAIVVAHIKAPSGNSSLECELYVFAASTQPDWRNW